MIALLSGSTWRRLQTWDGTANVCCKDNNWGVIDGRISSNYLSMTHLHVRKIENGKDFNDLLFRAPANVQKVTYGDTLPTTNHWLTSCAFHISHSMNNGIYSVYVIPLSLLNVHIHTTYRHTYLRISLCSFNYENKCKISLQRKKALSLPPVPLLSPFRRHSSRLGLLSKIHVKFHVN